MGSLLYLHSCWHASVAVDAAATTAGAVTKKKNNK
jgi:hypothetical protein